MSLTDRWWRGKGGTAYTERNRVDWRARVPFWRRVIERTRPRSLLEVGTNAGWNLRAIHDVDRDIQRIGVDLNLEALREASEAGVDAREASAVEVGILWPRKFDLVFTAGVLIHIPPEDLTAAMLSIRRASKRWVVAIEYFSPEEIEVKYRGDGGLLWKRPFGKLYQDLGMKIIEEFDAGDGFDRCRAWVMER